MTNRGPGPTWEPAQEDSCEALSGKMRRSLWIIIVVAGVGALTHQSLTAALTSTHRDSALKAAHTILTWPLPMTQPILAGVAVFVLLGMSVQSNGWREVTARQSRIALGFAIAAVLGAAPTLIVCLVIVGVFVLVVSVGLVFLLFLLLIRAR